MGRTGVIETGRDYVNGEVGLSLVCEFRYEFRGPEAFSKYRD